MNSNLKLSIIIANYNHSRFLEECFNSILEQSTQPFEVLICDDASTDNSVEIIKEYLNKSLIFKLHINNRNKGTLYTQNKLINLCRGEFVYALGADDKILPGFIGKSLILLEKYPDAGLCSAFTKLIDEAGQDNGYANNILVSRTPCFISPYDTKKIFLRTGESWILGTSTIFNRKVLTKIGGFLPELGAYADAFATQVIALNHGACFIPEILTCWRRMADGFDAQQAADPKIILKVIKSTVNIMTSQYSELFDPGYIKVLENKTLYFVHTVLWNNILKNQKQVISREYPEISKSVSSIDRLFFYFLLVVSYLQFTMIRIYYSFKYLNIFKELYFKTNNYISIKYFLYFQSKLHND